MMMVRRLVPAAPERHYRHSIASLTNTVCLQQMVEQVLLGLEVFSADRAQLPLRRGRVHVGNMLLEVADTAINASALFAYRFRLHTSITPTATGTTSWNPTTARCH